MAHEELKKLLTKRLDQMNKDLEAKLIQYELIAKQQQQDKTNIDGKINDSDDVENYD